MAKKKGRKKGVGKQVMHTLLSHITRAKASATGKAWRTLHRMEADAMRAAGKITAESHPKTAAAK